MESFQTSDEQREGEWLHYSQQHHISIHSDPHKRKNKKADLWIFDSPKNNVRMTVEGTVAYMHLILLEGDQSVYAYEPPKRTTTFILTESGEIDFRGIATINFNDGRKEWWRFRRAKTSPHKQSAALIAREQGIARAAKALDINYLIKTELDLKHKEVLFDNWLMLCAAMNRCRNLTMTAEMMALRRAITSHTPVILGSLLDIPGTDPALMLALIAKGLQNGTLKSDLDNKLFTLSSEIS